MKTILGSLFLLLIFVGCGNDDDNPAEETTIVGEWQLEAIYADPGDGSGDFEEIDSEKKITFNSDTTVSSTGSLCFFGDQSLESSDGTYNTAENTITGNDCGITPVTNTYVLDGNVLTIIYQCTESCQERYERI